MTFARVPTWPQRRPAPTYPETDGKPLAESDFQRRPLTYGQQLPDYAEAELARRAAEMRALGEIEARRAAEARATAAEAELARLRAELARLRPMPSTAKG